MKKIIIFLAIVILTVVAKAQDDTITGIVFEDKNRNGQFDAGEPGIADVAVSNQIDVVGTDADGRYVLPGREPMIVFITKPAGYQVPLDNNNLPQFYYIHQPDGSPPGLKFKGIEPTGPLPEVIDFPLIKVEESTRFTALITGDPQPRDQTEVSYFRDDIVAQMLGAEAAFYLALGDIAYDDLSIYDQYNRAVGKLGIPAYNVYGNHDMNFRVSDDRFAAETFRRIFGPEYYSFDYGNVHFVLLDNVDYAGWDSEKNRAGRYRGFISERQLQWLANDLALVPPDRLVVLAMHIPIVSKIHQNDNVKVVNRDELFAVLNERKHLLAVFAHMHVIEHIAFDSTLGWTGTSEFVGINTGAACGAWWSGPKDIRGIPESVCGDGSPNGYFTFEFDGVEYRYRFHPANRHPEYQMRISAPTGILSADSLQNRHIIVNVFAAPPQSRVTYRLNARPAVEMQLTQMQDPFMQAYFKQYRDLMPGWIRDVNEVSHIWTAPLPEDLSPGTHTIAVNAATPSGEVLTGHRLFEVEAESHE